MPKLGVFSGAELCRILELHGFMSVRQRGSHVVMQQKTGLTTITVPIPMHREIRIGTLQSIIRQSGLPRSEFER
jgi:predicted RNA binding protein YcfA (HicA-like mRNA interferase family)